MIYIREGGNANKCIHEIRYWFKPVYVQHPQASLLVKYMPNDCLGWYIFVPGCGARAGWQPIVEKVMVKGWFKSKLIQAKVILKEQYV